MATIQNNTMHGVSIQFKYKNAAQWTGSEVLLAGEIGLELDTKKYKLGDGSTAWSELAYYSNPQTDALVTALTERVSTAESSLTSLGTRMDTAEAAITSHGTRLDTAESDIDAAEGRLDTAEGNITSQGTRLTTAEGDIDAVEGRMDTAEADIDAAEADIATLKGITVISANPAPAQGA